MDSIFQTSDGRLLRAGERASLSIAVLTIVTFAAAMFAVPISGSNAPADTAFSYPFLDTLRQYPRDFIWQYLALFQLVCFVVFINLVKANAKPDKRLYAALSTQFALLSGGILLATYYCQVTVVPSSLAARATDGLGLIIQYNPYGLFIALEELGYMLMCLALYLTAPLFWGSRAGRTVAITLLVSAVVALVSLAVINLLYGMDKMDRFEVAIISIAWITLILVGFMLRRLFRAERKRLTSASA